jgi:Kef-type K+ transport system membrane component KefB
MSETVALFYVLAIIIATAKLGGHLSQRYLRQPVVFGEIIIGLVLGPSLLHILGWPLWGVAARDNGALLYEQIRIFASLGVLFLLFLAGLQTNLTELRTVGKTSTATATAGVLCPLFFGAVLARAVGVSWPEAFFIGTILTATSVSISTQTLLEIGQFRSREGLTILGAAVIDDILGVLLFSVIFAVLTLPLAAGEPAQVTAWLPALATTLVGMSLFLLVALYVGWRWAPALIAWASRLQASHAVLGVAVVLMLVPAGASASLGQMATITGAYLAGILLGRSPLKRRIERGIHPLTYAFFLPIFFTSIGLGVNIRDAGALSPGLLAVILAGAILLKFVGSGVGALATGFTAREAVRVGVGMVPRGEVALIVAQLGLGAALISAPTYTAVVLMVLFSTLLTPLLLKWVFPPHPASSKQVYESVIRPESDEDEF